MEFLWAGVSVLAAGLVLGPVLSSDENRTPVIALRATATVVMLFFGYASIGLFGDSDAVSSYLKMAAALWLPQLILGLVFISPTRDSE